MASSLCNRIVAVLTFAVLVSACQSDPEKLKLEYLRNGDRFAAEKNFQAAIVEYRNAIRQDERFGLARYKLAQAYAQIQNWQRARAEFVRAADLLPDDVEVQVAAALTLLQSGEFEDARSRAEVALKLNPDSADAHLVRGAAAAGLREFDAAIKAFEEGLVADPARTELHVTLGTVRTIQGNPREAEASFRQAVALNPQSVPARLALANFFWWFGRTAEAEQAINDALKIDPASVPANRALASYHIANKRPAAAEAPLRRAAEASEDPQPSLILSDYLVSENRHAEAAAVLDQLVDRLGVFAAATGRRAAIDYQLGQRDRAYQRLDELLAKQPKNAEVLVLKGKWLLSEKRIDEAFAVAGAALAADATFWPVHELLGSAHVLRYQADEAIRAFTEAVRLNPRAIYPQVALSELHLNQGKIDAGLSFAEEAVQSAPTSGLARFVLARTLVGKGDLERARTELQPVLLGSPKAAQVHALLGTIEEREGNLAAARAAYEQALALEPKTLDAVSGMVRLDTATRDIPRAVGRVQEYTNRAPDDPRAFYLAAQTYILAGEPARAEAALRRSIELNVSFTQAHHRLGELYLEQQKFDDARRVYDRLIELRPNDVPAHSMIALLLHSQQRYEEAKRVYERILSIDPRALVAANNLAYLYASDGEKLDVALSLAQTAKNAQPDDPDVNDTLGWVYYKRGLPTLAIPPFEQSIKAAPENPIYHYHLGLAYLQMGDHLKARTALERALELQPDFDGAAEARKALAAITE